MAPEPESERANELREYERGFRRDGLPMFSEDFTPSRDVFNRGAPLIGLVFLGEMLGAGQLDWTWWQNLLAIAGGLGILLLAFGAINVAKGRPFRTIPETLGTAELAGFVLIPALLPLIFGGQLGSALGTAAANIGLLLLIYGVVAYGLLWIIRWVLARIATQLRSSLGLIAKAVPLLAIFVLLSFPTQELWGIFAHPTRGIYALIVGLFVLLGAAFLVVRLPREARRLEAEIGSGSPPLKRRQLVNVGLVMFVSQAAQVLIVSTMIALFLMIFGVLAVDDSLRVDWLGSAGHEIFHFTLFGERLELTSPLLRVAVGLAAFSGFYFVIAMLTDTTYREEFLEELTSEMRKSFRERAEYLELRGKPVEAPAGTSAPS
jgi:hypothetical protein